ncbi:hypothetical protein BDY24DRAFT_444801 [Mrakia frigida]|uniref:uncharacterized protein n=1 Tax=Mrakia frigida TaxID=29902 RepID=UPI003FCC2627
MFSLSLLTCCLISSLYLLRLDRKNPFNSPLIPLVVEAAPSLPALEPSYSIWLSPSLSDEATSTLSSFIAFLPGPKFSPHATLLGEATPGTMLEDVLGKIEVAVEKASAGRGGKGVEAVFEDVRTGEGFFEVVLVKLKETTIDDSSLPSTEHRPLPG